MLSPRELNSASLPTRTFINERVTFTHGMGLTLGPVNEVTEEGLPVLFIKDLPPASSVSLAVKRPEIYFGELTDNWVFANTGQQEFDYPSGDQNIFGTYKGDGGVVVGGLLRRLVLAAYFRSLKVLLSSDITSASRAMYIRNIRARAYGATVFDLRRRPVHGDRWWRGGSPGAPFLHHHAAPILPAAPPATRATPH